MSLADFAPYTINMFITQCAGLNQGCRSVIEKHDILSAGDGRWAHLTACCGTIT